MSRIEELVDVADGAALRSVIQGVLEEIHKNTKTYFNYIYTLIPPQLLPGPYIHR